MHSFRHTELWKRCTMLKQSLIVHNQAPLASEQTNNINHNVFVKRLCSLTWCLHIIQPKTNKWGHEPLRFAYRSIVQCEQHTKQRIRCVRNRQGPTVIPNEQVCKNSSVLVKFNTHHKNTQFTYAHTSIWTCDIFPHNNYHHHHITFVLIRWVWLSNTFQHDQMLLENPLTVIVQDFFIKIINSLQLLLP